MSDDYMSQSWHELTLFNLQLGGINKLGHKLGVLQKGQIKSKVITYFFRQQHLETIKNKSTFVVDVVTL